ncbi:amino acid transporter [Phaffia rhodozyma]|uniref:Amino acid transporter n=1 Tax=Phaffia rhodozyma TaxID=264483 RepID=A0A0F7SPX0_PHARH|nr:amino acid transporter [Phaffia rhodozyma]
MASWSTEAADERIRQVEVKKDHLSMEETDIEKKGSDGLPAYTDTVVDVDNGGSHSVTGELTVQRKLKARHLAMIALGGSIGTGLFVGAGSALQSGGPVGCLLAYITMGAVIYTLMIALGEMATLFPDSGGLTHYATRFLDPAMGFTLGWNYWFSYGITLPTELVAASIIIQYWNATINVSAWIAPLFVAMMVVNLLGVRAYGEMEFIFSAMKIIAVVGLIILGICINCGAGPESDGYIGFRYWKNPGPFNQYTSGDTVVGGSWGRFLAFWNVFVQAAFSFLGSEIVVVAVGETENPRKNVPKAIKRVFWRLLIFYVLAILIIGLLVPYTDSRLLNGSDDVSASPFVIAILNAGIKGLPSVINAVLLIAAWSAGNSDIYASSRTLYALALEGKAPRFFRKCTKDGMPYWSVLVTGLFGFLAFLGVGSGGAAKAFDWLFNLSSMSGLLVWWTLFITYLRFYYGMKKQGLNRDDLPYKAPFQPYASWIGTIFLSLVIIFNGFGIFVGNNFTASKFFAAYVCILVYVLFYGPWKLWGGERTTGSFRWLRMTKMVSLEEMDFETGRRELDEMDRVEQEKHPEPTSIIQKIWGWMF